ncbi:MAG: hypothetical protein Q9195_007580 [Heterodermia aff. obscurata]
MAPYLDYDALRAQAIGTGSDEAVTVNTRALIDKVLARYSGEWTTLRELIQNAADASAKKVTIRLETSPSSTVAAPQGADPSKRIRHVLLHHTLKSSIIENDGVPFGVADWARLKKIAEGNPDETKIGAFGVGFYSVFADCEEPFVSSGKEALAFYWKGDALFTKRLQLPDSQNSNTTFVLPMRNATSPVPQLLSLCQFLASSLTFVGLDSIDLWLDEWKILDLKKVTAPSFDLEIPTSIDGKTSEGLMKVTKVTKEAAQIHARWLKVVEWKRSFIGSTEPSAKEAHSTPSLRTFFSRIAPGVTNSNAEKAAREERAQQDAISDNLMGEATATLFLHVNRASIRTIVSQRFNSELERATKKPPPKTTTVSLLTASYDEHVASASSTSDTTRTTADIFTSVVPTRGRIFIGFPTNQTTGLQAHISTPSVIPTVERESIDLNNRFIRTWNVELLRAAGIVARLSWQSEMSTLKDKLLRSTEAGSNTGLTTEQVSQVIPEALFLHTTFAFNESTPISEVGTLVEEAFWTCGKQMAIDILSSQGVLPSSRVRCLSEDLGFVQGIPVVPKPLIQTSLIKRLKDYGVITDVTILDIKSELGSRPLDARQLQKFLPWVAQKWRINEIDNAMIRSLLEMTVFNYTERSGIEKVLFLGQITNFVNPSKIPPDMPIPQTTMPFKYSQPIARIDLEALGWEDLNIVPWLKWLVEQTDGKGELPPTYDITQSASFARTLLPILSKQWDGLSQSSKATVTELMTPRTTIPTKLGMRRPGESYFSSVKLFDDLPVVVGLQSVKDKMLAAFGVRKTVDIGVVLDRLVAFSDSDKQVGDDKAGHWNHVDLIKYLASVQQDIPSNDIKRLKSTPICPAESSSSTGTSPERYLVSGLFEPEDNLRRLDFPILQWPGPLRMSSAEGKLLTLLGLRSAPTYLELIDIMASAAASGDVGRRDRALGYLLNQYQLKGYSSFDTTTVVTPYLPIQGSEKRLQIPQRCFLNERNAILGFDILRRDLHPHASKFGVQVNPPITECIDRLIKNPPPTHRNAREVFTYFASRVTELDNSSVIRIGETAIVPLAKTKHNEKADLSDDVRYLAPKDCFLGDGDKYADIFDYVDFGQDAGVFLLKCGSKHEPNVQELAAKVIREPARVYTSLETPKYLDLLRSFASAWPTLKKNKALAKDMKAAPFLLGNRELVSKNTRRPSTLSEKSRFDSSSNYADADEDEDDAIVRTAELECARKITVVNDTITYAQFREHILAAPMEEVLEEFYLSLGSPELGDLLEQQHTIGDRLNDQSMIPTLQRRIVERTRLYLYDQPRETVSHDAKWIEKNLSLAFVQSISLSRSLKGTNIRRYQPKSAMLSCEKRGGFLLNLTPEYDFFEVAQALIGLLIKRPKPQQIMMLEMLLGTGIHKLKAKGYNVERILRQKAIEASVAEEQRRRQVEQEQEELRSQEAAQKEAEMQNAGDGQRNPLPGGFPESPDSKSPIPIDTPMPQLERPIRNARGFFSKISKTLGIEDRAKLGSQDSNNRGVNNSADDAPPPYSQQDIAKRPHTPAPQPETVTQQHQLKQNLLNIIQASRPHNSRALVSTPAVTHVKETQSYCDSRPAADMVYISETSTSPPVRIYLAKDVFSPPYNISPAQFLASNAHAVNAFAGILLECADLFKLTRRAVHVYYDTHGTTIAFNLRQSLFFNYRYFENLHLEKVQQRDKSEALVYWAVCMMHELAHNVVEDHSSDHSYYTESLVIQFLPAIAAKITELGSGVLPSVPLSSGPSAGPSGSGLLVDVD